MLVFKLLSSLTVLNLLAGQHFDVFASPSASASLLSNATNLNPVIQQQQVTTSSSAASASLLTSATSTTTSASSAAANQGQNGAFSGAFAAAPTPAKGKYKTIYACEDLQLVMDCEYGSKINLIRANFGRFSVTQCNEQGRLDLSTECMAPSSLRLMRERCQDRRSCSVNATSAIFGDRCPKTPKYLEVHFQCQPDQFASSTTTSSSNKHRQQHYNNNNQQQQQHLQHQQLQLSRNSADAIEVVDVRNLTRQFNQLTAASQQYQPPGPILPPNNPMFVGGQQQQQAASRVMPQGQQQPQQHPLNAQTTTSQQPITVINSEIITYNAAVQDPRVSREPDQLDQAYLVSLKHSHTDSISNPRCYQWDQAAYQWTDRGAQVRSSNQTHTVCAYNQATSYILVMDYLDSQQNSHQVSVCVFANLIDVLARLSLDIHLGLVQVANKPRAIDASSSLACASALWLQPAGRSLQ